MNFPGKHALSAVELFAGLLIFLAVIGSVYAILVVGKVSWSTSGSSIVTQQQARGALDVMVRELRTASRAEVKEQGKRIDFFVKGKGEIRYFFDKGKVMRTDSRGESPDGAPIILAENIKNLGFVQRTPKSVQIKVTSSEVNFLNSNQEFTMVGNINMRGD